MEEIDITKHPEVQAKHASFGRRFNLMPIILIGAIIFILFRTDMKSFFESEQFKKNTNYIKTSITNVWNKYSEKAKLDFFKAPSAEGTNKTKFFNLNNFLPQTSIQNNALQNASSLNQNPTTWELCKTQNIKGAKLSLYKG